MHHLSCVSHCMTVDHDHVQVEVTRREQAEAAAAANTTDAERVKILQDELAHAEAKHKADHARAPEDNKLCVRVFC